MSNIVIKVSKLGKRYRIGRPVENINSGENLLKSAISPFKYLAHSLRKPNENEIIWALKDISFEVKEGQVVGIIGRNGAGKSTLLKILSRVTDPTEGRVEIEGRVAALLEVGTGFHPELTGRENIYLSGAILGMKRNKIPQKFDEIVHFSGVEKFIDTPIKYYSSGMRVRLGFAVAAHLEPEVLLVDEVLAVGDAEFQKRCFGKMSSVSKEGRTILFVSHNMAAIRSLCNRCIFILDGSVSFDGNVSKAIDEYLQTIEEFANEDLTIRSDRSGEGRIIIKNIEIKNPQNPLTGKLRAGDPANFKFTLNYMDPEVILDYVDFTIYDKFGNAVTYFNSAERGSRDLSDSKLYDLFFCKIDELYLVPGRYHINAGIKAGGKIQDRVEGAAYFYVGEGVVGGRLVPNNERQENIVLPHLWVNPGLDI